MSVGVIQGLLLDEFGYYVWAIFGEYPYHVGSSVKKKTGWRDVDVRLILNDEEYEHLALGNPKEPHSNEKWVALTRIFSHFGTYLTGLPIDFQVQQQSEANAQYSQKDSHIRSALGCTYRARMCHF